MIRDLSFIDVVRSFEPNLFKTLFWFIMLSINLK